MYHIILKKSVAKQYAKLPEKDRDRVHAALQGLREDPWQGKKLEGEFAGLYGIRVWPYRILYMIEKHIVTVTVVRIGHRKDVYK